MMLNYRGSFVNRNVKLTSGIKVNETDTSVENFNSLMVFVPSYLAANNIVSYDGSGLTPTTQVVKTVTADNYSSVLKGELLSQWGKVFNDGANSAVILYVVVFYCTLTDWGTYFTVAAKTIGFAPLTTAFEKFYPAAYFKFMFSEHYNGTTSTTEGSAYDDSHYFDLALCLAYLVANETKVSANVPYVILDLTSGGSNSCHIIDKTLAEEEAALTALNVTIEGVTNPRDYYFWGALHLVAGDRVYCMVHSEAVNYVCQVLKLFYSATNAAGVYVGNKLDLIRLTGDYIKPTGLPSSLDASVNENLTEAQYTVLDAKGVGYLMSIADGTGNNSVLSQFVSVTDQVPVLAPMMSKYIDWHASKDIALWLTANKTLTDPVLKSELAYEQLKSILNSYFAMFAKIGRITNVQLNFPAYSAQTGKNSFTVNSAWTVDYVYDMKTITLSGTVTV